VVAHSDTSMIGQVVPRLRDLEVLSQASVFERLRVVYAGEGQMLEFRQPLVLGDDAFGSIRIGISTLLVRDTLITALEPAPDYEMVCRASGGHGERVEDPAQLPDALRRALRILKEEKRQVLLNVICKKP